MSKTFTILYSINLGIIIIGLLFPSIKLLNGPATLDELFMSFYAVLLLLSVTFCIPFLGLNVYRARKDRPHWLRYAIIAAFLGAWIIYGTYQIAFLYTHEVPLFS